MQKYYFTLFTMSTPATSNGSTKDQSQIHCSHFRAVMWSVIDHPILTWEDESSPRKRTSHPQVVPWQTLPMSLGSHSLSEGTLSQNQHHPLYQKVLMPGGPGWTCQLPDPPQFPEKSQKQRGQRAEV